MFYSAVMSRYDRMSSDISYWEILFKLVSG